MMWYILVTTLEPDLTPLGFFLWRHLKAKVLLTHVTDLLMLKRQIQAEIGKTWWEMLQKVYENVLAR